MDEQLKLLSKLFGDTQHEFSLGDRFQTKSGEIIKIVGTEGNLFKLSNDKTYDIGTLIKALSSGRLTRRGLEIKTYPTAVVMEQ